MPKAEYTERQRRISKKTVMMIGGIFAFTTLVFAILFGTGTFIAGS